MVEQSQRIGVGIIGAGIMGTSHAASLADDPRARLVGVAALPQASAAELADRYRAHHDQAAEAPRATDDYHDLLADPAVDLVTVATPDDRHHEICLAALAAGKHVFVEKPLTTSLAEADELVTAVEQADTTLMTCFNHRWMPPYARAKAEIAAGNIGRPRMAYARKNDRIFVPTEMLSWAADTTCAWFLSSHDIDLANWFFDDRPVSVYANSVSGVLTGRGIDTPDAIQAQVTYEGGGVATFESCWIYPNTYPTMTDSWIQVTGERGVLQLPRIDDQVWLTTEESYEFPRQSVGSDIHGRRSGAVTAALHHMISCILDGTEPLITIRSSRDVTAVLDALHRSLESHRVEPIT
ncbi:Gfo/Idh/MocA family protein [Microlunatus sp. Y2014]|uniref:Gfo/Idh/MocA family protein n=1 Tax=Microlunatus sp. Y2014 TaxID=3418488 RepID=UPI003DA74367